MNVVMIIRLNCQDTSISNRLGLETMHSWEAEENTDVLSVSYDHKRDREGLIVRNLKVKVNAICCLELHVFRTLMYPLEPRTPTLSRG